MVFSTVMIIAMQGIMRIRHINDGDEAAMVASFH